MKTCWSWYEPNFVFGFTMYKLLKKCFLLSNENSTAMKIICHSEWPGIWIDISHRSRSNPKIKLWGRTWVWRIPSLFYPQCASEKIANAAEWTMHPISLRAALLSFGILHIPRQWVPIYCFLPLDLLKKQHKVVNGEVLNVIDLSIKFYEGIIRNCSGLVYDCLSQCLAIYGKQRELRHENRFLCLLTKVKFGNAFLYIP